MKGILANIGGGGENIYIYYINYIVSKVIRNDTSSMCSGSWFKLV